MKKFCGGAVALSLAGLVPLTHAQQAVRVACANDNAGAIITVNGKVVGDCPIDVMVAPGQIRLRAAKKVGADQERTWEQEFTLGPGAVKRVDVVLGAPQVTQEAKDREAARREAERQAALRREEEQKKEAEARRQAQEQARMDLQQAVQAAQKGAESGDAAAMLALSNYLQAGDGLPRDDAQSLAWLKKAAELRHQPAVDALATLEASEWTQAQGRRSRSALAAFLARHPGSAQAAQARQALEAIPKRPAVKLDEGVWAAIEASEAHGRMPDPVRRVKVARDHTIIFSANNRMREVGDVEVAPTGSGYVVTTDTLLLGADKDAVGGPRKIGYAAFGGLLPLVQDYDSGRSYEVRQIREVSGSLLPPRVGARMQVKYHAANLLFKQQLENDMTCRMGTSGPATAVHARVTGLAWRVECRTAVKGSGMEYEKVERLFYFEDLALFDKALGIGSQLRTDYWLPVAGATRTTHGTQEAVSRFDLVIE